MRSFIPYSLFCVFVLAACSGESSNAQHEPSSIENDVQVWNTHPQWEWVGDRISYFVREGDATRIVTVRSDGTEKEELDLGPGNHANPTYSARNGKIGFSSAPVGSQGAGDIWVANIDGSQREQITDTPEREMQPAWDVAGIMIAFIRVVDGNSDIWIVNSRNGLTRQLTKSVSNESHPKWSNEGNRLYYDKTTDASFEVCTMDIITRQEICLVTFEGMVVSTPAPTRSGDRVIFAMAEENETSDLWEIEVESGELLQITDTPMESESAPFLSPDGSQIAFHSGAGGSHHIYVMNRNGTNRRNISK
ncbi:MAG: hypothetical protein HOL68_03305 [Bacteroidetes Order II. Incertae sedis bacterium]|jgi:Tol biopolymer transport system component|nr:hypothetical protein [Bacteroidetes Order II. bacterium]MBT7400864.1 hypothetical protein [Bacteroidetes Order II. bacterium]